MNHRIKTSLIIVLLVSFNLPAIAASSALAARTVTVSAVLVFAASFYLRTTGGSRMVSGSYTLPLLLSVLGVILITISGYLGGELVFRHGVAVNPQYDTGEEAREKARTG
jgi:uncharacterized membrane protein